MILFGRAKDDEMKTELECETFAMTKLAEYVDLLIVELEGKE